MGSLVPVFSDNIRMEDMTLDFSLEATRSDYPDQSYSYDGKNTIIGPYRDGYAFGITSIEIDTSLNMQPQIEITFKDLYGNLVFKNGGNSELSKLFELPPPKFTLTFKGYVGQPIKYLLQLRSTSVNYVTSDGSYEIKCKFVPNIYGFFGDIPYKFLYAVDKLKNSRGTPLNSSSILNIIKNGDTVNDTVQTASEQFDKIKNKLNTLLGSTTDGSSLYDAVVAGTFSNNGTAYQVDNIPGDSALTAAGFKPINFNFNNKNSAGVYYSLTADTSIYGLAVVRSINQTQKIDLSVTTPTDWRATTRSLSSTTADITKLIQDNLTAIDKATNKSAGSQISMEVLDSQTISSVMSSIAGESAYVLGYILEGAINGLNAAPNRRQDDKIIGLYYPLVYQTNSTAGANGETVYEQIPDPNAVTEMQYVQAFMKAQYEGTQQVQKYNEEQEAKQNGTEGAVQQGSELKKRITNAEAFKANPYANGARSNAICINMLQRAGIINTRMAGPLSNDSDYSNERIKINESEYLNIKLGVEVLTGTDREEMRNFANRVTTFFNSDGKPSGKKWTDPVDSGNTATYQSYFQGFFEGMKTNGLDNKMFLNSDPTQLICLYLNNNDVLYNNEKDLTAEFGSNDVYVYVPSSSATLTNTANSTGATDVSEILNGSDSDPSAPYKANGDFFKFQKAKEWGGLSDSGTKVISYEKMTDRSYHSVKDMTIKIGKTASTGVIEAADGDYVAPLYKAGNNKSYVLSMKSNSEEMMKTLYYWCNKLKTDIPATDAKADQNKAQQEKQAAAGGNGDGTSMETQTVEPYSFDANVYNAIYHQFHHIASAWSNILKSSLQGQDANGLASSKKLAEAMEEAYRNDKPNATLPYSMSYAMAVQMSNVTNESLKKAIVNTTSLRETDTESSTFSMMSNLAQQNNFLMQSIPGGLKSGSDEFDIDSLFTPVVSYNKESAPGNASLCFIWQPTPESRSLNNKSEFIYGDAEKFKASLDSLPGSTKIPWLQFGSPDNIIVKSIKATTDENKVTGESIAAVDDIISPDNQNKKRAFDCSMLSVMQGRSYKIGMEILGNANFLPTQRFAITNLPIFTGLYWTSNVKHSITPNSMTTNIEAMKLKYDGGNFGGVLPVTTATYKGDTGTFGGGGGGGGGGGTGGGGGGGENILSDGLNWDFLQKVKDEKMKNAADINAFIKKYTSNKFNTYPEWFNSQIAKKKQFCDSLTPAKQWTSVWDTIIPIVYPDYGNTGINFLEFLALNMIIYGETGAAFTPVSEHMNKLSNPIPGIAYAFNQISGVKASYNKPGNKLASVLFSDPQFIAAHGNLPFGKDNRVLKSQNAAWKGFSFPLDQFTTDKDSAVNPDTDTFINQADFFKFRGRGYIGSTWRDGYKRIVEYILSYNGADSTVKNYKGKWKGAPYNGNADNILTMSSNDDWDTLFRTSNAIPGWAIFDHASRRHSYQYFKDLTQSRQTLEKKLYNVGLYVNGDQTGKYEQKHMMRVYQQLDELSPSTKVKTNNSNNANNNYQPPPPPAGTSQKAADAVKGSLTKLFATYPNGEKSRCGIYVATAAKSYVDLLKNPKATISSGAYNGGRGNAKDLTLRNYLQGLGYTVTNLGSKLTKKDLTSKLSSLSWGLGDITIYWADDKPKGWDTCGAGGYQVIYGHIQFYQGNQYSQALFASSRPANYVPKGYFVYNSTPNEQWNLYVCRAPAAPA